MNLENKLISAKTILNIQKIQKIIIVWRNINVLTDNSTRTSLNTIDIPTNKEIKRNNTKIQKPYDLRQLMTQL